jgi:hypothetical protein
VTVAAPAHPVRWSAPAPLWGDADVLATPVLLRLRGDRFMDELRALLARDPEAIAGLRATPRSHRVRPPGRPADWGPAGAPPRPLKLYGAVHREFNLVAASLVCGVPGLPERRLRTAEGDRVVFVLRRLTADGEEGWVPGTPDGAWKPAAGGELLDGEEQLPMFSLDYTGDEGVPRKLHVGLVPTTSVDTWAPPPPPPTKEDAAVAAARRLGEMRQLVDTYRSLASPDAWHGSSDHLANAMDAVDVWLIELADFLQRWHPAAWQASAAPGVFTGAPLDLAAVLRAYRLSDGTTLAARVHEAWARREPLLGEAAGARQTLALHLDTLRRGSDTLSAETLAMWIWKEPAAAEAPLPSTAGVNADARAARRPKLDPSGSVEHVIRCAYLRPHCEKVHGPIVSAPTERFRLASFFDPDAPARDVHIALPIGTGVKDLRKLRKSVSVGISEQLQRQMSRVGELKDDFKAKEGQEIDFGLVCSFSIPIVTICALIVLMIFVIILNLIFFWLPLLKICLPVPKGAS